MTQKNNNNSISKMIIFHYIMSLKIVSGEMMKILIVEDDVKISSFLKKGLEEEYFCVDLADNGNDAVYMAKVNLYDAIILDLMMPGMNGQEVCAKLREENIQTPIIILSAKNSIDDKVELLNLGADDYISKPFSMKELIARMNVQFRKRDQKDNILQLADLIVDCNAKSVTRNGNKIDLTAKEYALLEYLIRHKKMLISEEVLKNQLYSFDESAASNILNVYLYRLRNKIDKNYDKKLLKTVRNLGYTLSDDDV